MFYESGQLIKRFLWWDLQKTILASFILLFFVMFFALDKVWGFTIHIHFQVKSIVVCFCIENCGAHLSQVGAAFFAAIKMNEYGLGHVRAVFGTWNLNYPFFLCGYFWVILLFDNFGSLYVYT